MVGMASDALCLELGAHWEPDFWEVEECTGGRRGGQASEDGCFLGRGLRVERENAQRSSLPKGFQPSIDLNVSQRVSIEFEARCLDGRAAAIPRAVSEFVFSQEVGTLISANPHESGTEITQHRISEDERRLVFLVLPPVARGTEDQFRRCSTTS